MVQLQQGRSRVDGLLAARRLQRVPANQDLARALLEQARAHVRTSVAAEDDDAIGSFQLAYDAARKALTAVLAAQGLRPTSRGGHAVVEEAVSAQFVPPHGGIVAPFRWMRPLRNDSEYPSLGRPVARAEDAAAARTAAMGMVEWAAGLIQGLSDYGE